MIVITSIFSPTAAVEAFARLSPGEVVVIGDKRSPEEWHLDGVEFISATDQESQVFKSAELLPWNHYSRKNLGYLRAMERGAGIITESDDDNLPLANWAFPNFSGTYEEISGADFVNIYSHFTQEHVWPRGLPLDTVLSADTTTLQENWAQVGVWQALADGDPDVDAIYRLTINKPIEFDKSVPPRILAPGTVCPFNSQNTAFSRPAFPLLYLPATVTFRFTDILRGLVAQPIMWAAGLRLGFTTATVFQDRNVHDFMHDFMSEIPCYLEARRVIDTVGDAVKPDSTVEENLRSAYAALAHLDIVKPGELGLVDAWLADVASLLD